MEANNISIDQETSRVQIGRNSSRHDRSRHRLEEEELLNVQLLQAKAVVQGWRTSKLSKLQDHLFSFGVLHCVRSPSFFSKLPSRTKGTKGDRKSNLAITRPCPNHTIRHIDLVCKKDRPPYSTMSMLTYFWGKDRDR
ncbi:hypothetical protein Taro_037994 [Colocasia esculenta]|uniref:Uncharacterized protein n=1 Tax=Colocasia esculenta TaxID=4460 RepID=A0A843WBG2_COLES|nr:hypothetical protein [Colocasia esculenta]